MIDTNEKRSKSKVSINGSEEKIPQDQEEVKPAKETEFLVKSTGKFDK